MLVAAAAMLAADSVFVVEKVPEPPVGPFTVTVELPNAPVAAAVTAAEEVPPKAEVPVAAKAVPAAVAYMPILVAEVLPIERFSVWPSFAPTWNCTPEKVPSSRLMFLVYIPFVLIDLAVASILMSLGMIMVSPTLISLPLKLLVFVSIHGWVLVLGTLANSFG